MDLATYLVDLDLASNLVAVELRLEAEGLVCHRSSEAADLYRDYSLVEVDQHSRSHSRDPIQYSRLGPYLQCLQPAQVAGRVASRGLSFWRPIRDCPHKTANSLVLQEEAPF